jgi:5-methylcytosine-specific restriction endonuclease McrA
VINISEYYCKDDWKTKVYKPSEDDFDKDSPEWISMKVFLLIQQKNKCARCKKKLTASTISIHHIIPRSEGGTNDIKNIIGLCVNCHNVIEPKNLKREDIVKYYKRRKFKNIASKNDWHLWVYGGFNRFLKNEKRIIIEEREEEVKYSYPENVVLHKEIFKKGIIDIKLVYNPVKKAKKVEIKKVVKKNKCKKLIKKRISYIEMFGITKRELSMVFRVTEPTIHEWVKDKSKCEKIRLVLAGKI